MSEKTACLIVDDCQRTPFDALLAPVLMMAPGLPSDAAIHYLREAAIQLCKRSRVLVQDIEVEIQPCVANPIIEPLCADLDIEALHKVCGRDVIASTPCPCDGWGCSVRFLPPNQLELYPAPASTTQQRLLPVTISVRPRHDACEIPTVLFDRYAEVIQAGALKDILRLPAEFKDKQLAETYKREFEGGVTAAGMDRLLGYSLGPIKMRSSHYRIV